MRPTAGRAAGYSGRRRDNHVMDCVALFHDRLDGEGSGPADAPTHAPSMTKGQTIAKWYRLDALC